MNSTAVSVTALLAAGVASAQTNLFSNAGQENTIGLSTGSLTDSGVVAPTNNYWSELQDDSVFSCNSLSGVAGHSLGEAGSYRLADNFTVTGTESWRLDTASFYVYQTGWTQGASPFAGVNVRIWQGRPWNTGSSVVWGDTSTNRFIGSHQTNLYRVLHTTMPPFPASPTTSRRVWRVIASLGNVVLPPGDYWLDWQFTNISGNGEALVPPLTFVGERGRQGANALQLRPIFGGRWIAITDEGKPSPAGDVAQELPFILSGTGQSCNADFDGDGFLSGGDFDRFVEAFDTGAFNADFDQDGFVSGADFDAYVAAFESGC